MSRKTIVVALAVAVVAGVALGSSTAVEAQYCEGTVHGLSRHYNLATGSGFLAVRKRPTSSSPHAGAAVQRRQGRDLRPARRLVPDIHRLGRGLGVSQVDVEFLQLLI